MKIIVQKYGGSSVANVDRIKNVAARIKNSRRKGTSLVVVVSALGRSTNNLIELASGITDTPSRREMDMLLSTGEQVSTSLLAMALHKIGVKAVSLTGFQVGITTDSVHTKARISAIGAERILKELSTQDVAIVAGFQGIDKNGNITTLGRGGSDLTAVALAKVLKATACEIYTDVDGIYSADPRTIKSARKILKISYEEMLELASSGAQVMQARSIEFAGKFNVPIHVRSSFSKKTGTWIVKGDKTMEDVLVRGVNLNKKEAKITLADVPDRPGSAARIFRLLADAAVNVDMIIQNVSQKGKRYTDISFTVPAADLNETMKTLKNSPYTSKTKITSTRDIAKISVVGIGMRSHSGIAADMFEVLGKNRINIDMISTSEIKISCIVSKKDAEKAAKALHKHFVE